jgi:hypothetical protein
MERDKRCIRRGLELPVTLGNLTSKSVNRVRLKCDGFTAYMLDWLHIGRDMMRVQTQMLILHI